MTGQTDQIRQQVQKAISGKDEIIDKVLMVILAGGHILLEDVPGVGKTTLALAFSRAMGMSFQRVQFTPDVVPSDITGFTMYEKETGKFTYKPGAAMCNLLLADEINRTSSKTQSALLEVMQENAMTVDGEVKTVIVQRHSGLVAAYVIVIACFLMDNDIRFRWVPCNKCQSGQTRQE